MRNLVVFLMLLPLAACGLFPSKQERALRRSPDYKAGYQDGCNSAWSPDANKRHDDTIVRDDQHVSRTTRPIVLGWDKGLNACRNTGYSSGVPQGPPTGGPIPDHSPGNGGPRGL